MFSGNEDVSFGDVNLSEEQVRGNHNPGQGGWPTIRYFNEATGYEGAAYTKKTSKSMCDELGDDAYMRAYVEEQGNTSLCSAETGKGCSEKERKYLDKMKPQPESALNQLTRLEGMKNTRMSPANKKWLGQRLAILKQLATRGDASAAKEEL